MIRQAQGMFLPAPAEIPAHSAETERAVLGAPIRDDVEDGRAVLAEIRRLGVAVEAFYIEAHRIVFRHLCALADADRPVSLGTALISLRESEELESIGGEVVVRLIALDGTVPGMIERHVEELLRLALKREGEQGGRLLAEHARNGSDPVALAAEARALAERLTTGQPAGLKPAVSKLGDDVTVTWPARGVVIRFLGVHDGREGLRAEVSAALHGRDLEPWGGVNLAATRSRQDKARAFASVAPGLPWAAMLDQASALVRDAVRAGEPPRELQRVAVTAPRYLVHPLLPLHRPTVVFADGGSCKTQLAHGLAYSVRHGVALPGMGRPSTSTPAYILDWESDGDDGDERGTLAADALGVPVTGVHYKRMAGALVYHVAAIRREMARTGARFGIVDSMGPALGDTIRDGLESATIRFFEALREIGPEITWLILTHMTKNDAREPGPAGAKPYGSVYVYNEARAVWRLDAVQDGPTATVTFTNTKNNRGPKHRPFALRLTFTEDGQALTLTTAGPAAQLIPTRDPVTVEQRVRVCLSTGPLTVAELGEATGKGEWAIRKALQRLGDAVRAIPGTKGEPQRHALVSTREEQP